MLYEVITNGRILEMEGLPDLSVEQAFELTDAAAEVMGSPVNSLAWVANHSYNFV